jgi:B12-binding domain/radical SAM domain protein of rhizo-twelve system
VKVALVNPHWTYEGSVYFGCREPHLPLELGAAKVLLEAAGHETIMVDAHLFDLTHEEMARQVRIFAPDMIVITTAPTYLFWRCAPPELRVPRDALTALDNISALRVAIGPHASTTPRAAMRKLAVDMAVMGEPEEALVQIANGETDIPGTVTRRGDEVRVLGGPRATRFTDLPALRWGEEWIARHHHHHHRFDATPTGPGAEVEASRGCPYHCTFCAKENFRDAYRRRELPVLLEEIDALIAQGAEYVYFVDEIFLPNKPLLEALADRPIKFGVQTRIDLWKPEMIRLLGAAGCVSVEAGVESLTPEGRDALDKRCKLSTEELSERLILAKAVIPFVQANLIEVPSDDPATVEAWRLSIREKGVWANDPVPLFPYPGSPDYRRLWGLPDDQAWERAVNHYIGVFDEFSDVQAGRPVPLAELERS